MVVVNSAIVEDRRKALKVPKFSDDSKCMAYAHEYTSNPEHLQAWVPAVLDSAGAAALLGCSVSHIQALARAGILPCNRAPSGRWRFGRDALIAWAGGSIGVQ